MSTLDSILEEIKKANSIVILTHQNPDGDAVGSALAMNLALKKLGKNADVIIPSTIFIATATPQNVVTYTFLFFIVFLL